MQPTTSIYFKDGNIVSKHGEATVYEMSDELFLEVGPGHNLWALESVKFKLIFDTKKRISKGRVTLASVELANEKVKFFTTDDVPEGYDCIVVVDALAWQYASDKDKKRIISHELNHVVFNEKGKVKLS